MRNEHTADAPDEQKHMQICITSKLLSAEELWDQDTTGWSVQSHTALQISVVNCQTTVPAQTMCLSCSKQMHCLFDMPCTMYTHAYQCCDNNSPKCTLCRAMATGPLQESRIDHCPLHPTIDTPQLPLRPLPPLSPAPPCPYNSVAAT